MTSTASSAIPTKTGISMSSSVLQKSVPQINAPMHTQAESRTPQIRRWVLLLLILAGFGLRVYRLDLWNIWGDEWFSIRSATASLGWMLGTAQTAEPHPLLYYCLLSVWVHLAGIGEFTARYWSLIMGVMLIPAVYKLGTELFNANAGMIAALLVTANPYLIWHDRNTRMYSQLVLLAALSTYFLLAAIRTGKRGMWAGYALAMLLGLYTHYSYTLVVLGQACYILVAVLARRDKARILKPWFIANAIAGLLFLPWLLYAYSGVLSFKGNYLEYVPPQEVIRRLVITFSLGTGADTRLSPAFALFWVVFWLVGMVMAARSKPRSVYAELALIGVPLILLNLSYLVRPNFDERYFLITVPVFLVGVAAGIAGLARNLPRLITPVFVPAALVLPLAVNLVMLDGYYFDPGLSRTDFRAAVRFIESHRTPDDVVVYTNRGNYNLMSYYEQLYHQGGGYNDLVLEDTPSGAQLPFGPRSYLVENPGDIPQVMAQIAAAKPHTIWFIPYWNLPVDTGTQNALMENNYFVQDRWFTQLHVLTFLSPASAVQERTLDRHFGDALLLQSSLLDANTSVEPGQSLHLDLAWSATKKIERDYAFSIRLLDAQGHVVLQRDRQSQNGPHPTSTWSTGERVIDRYGIRIPTGTLPGTYRIEVYAYDPANGATLAVTGVDGGPVSSALGEITVLPPAGALPSADDLQERIADLQLQPQTGVTAQGIRLVASAVAQGSRSAGESLRIVLLWQAEAVPDGDPQVTLAAGNESHSSIPLAAAYPPRQWRSGDVFLEYYDLPIAATAQSGPAAVMVRLGNAETTIGQVEIKARPHAMQPPVMQHTASARFGMVARLAGYDSQPEQVKPGDTLTVTLYWQSLTTAAPGAVPLKVFVHMLNSEGQLVAQHDSEPSNGTLRTNTWTADEYITDPHALKLPENLAPGEYRLEVGLYNPETTQRIPLHAATGDSAVLEQKVIVVR